MQLTKQRMLEHAIWLNLVERRLEERLFFKLVIVIIIVDAAKLLSLFIQEFEISRALVLDLLFVGLVVPVGFLLPFLVFLVILILVGKIKIIFPLSFLTVCITVNKRYRVLQGHQTYSSKQPAGSEIGVQHPATNEASPAEH